VKILYINPVGSRQFDEGMKAVLRESSSRGTEVDVVSLERGPRHVEYMYYEGLVLADVMHIVKRAETDRYDAVVLGCFYDLALQEAREISERMVITAPAESCMLNACSLGDKFSIVVGRRKWVPQMMGTVVKYGLRDRLASFKVLDLGVLDFQKEKEETERRQRKVIREALENDGAEVIILGCTAEFGFWATLQKEFRVPVLDPVIVPLKYAEHLVGLRDRFGWSHSKLAAYESPSADEIRQWKIGEQYETSVWGRNTPRKKEEKEGRVIRGDSKFISKEDHDQ